MHFLLLPGLDGTGELFGDFIAETPDGSSCRVVRYPEDEALSFGECAELVVEQALPDAPFVIIAESYSGPVGLLVAASRPAKLRGLVLCNSFASPPAWFGWRLLPWRRLMATGMPRWLVRSLLTSSAGVEDLLESLRNSVSSVEPAVLAARVRQSLAVDVGHVTDRLEVPVLYLRGTRDRVVAARAVERLASRLPALRVVHVVGPHLLLQVAPEACWRAIGLFVAAECGD